MDPAGNAGASPLAAVAAGQRVWVRLSADASRAHGPALLMRLLADCHPDALAAGAAAPTATQQPTDASAQLAPEAGGPAPEPGDMAAEPTGEASFAAGSAGEVMHRLRKLAAHADAKLQQALPPPVPLPTPAEAAAPGGRRAAHPRVSAAPVIASSSSEWGSNAACTITRQQQRQQQQQHVAANSELPAKYSIAQALAQAVGQAMLCGGTPSGLVEVAESGRAAATPERLCMRAHLLPRHPPQYSSAATTAQVRFCRSATCP